MKSTAFIILVFSLGLDQVSSINMDNRTTLPSPPGPHPVSVTSHELFTDRYDPLAPTTEKRRLMLSAFQPLTKTRSCPKPLTYLPYMPPAASEVWVTYAHDLLLSVSANIFDRLQITSCDAADATTISSDSPLLAFSPGAGTSRFLYDTFNQAFASSGYTVISIITPMTRRL